MRDKKRYWLYGRIASHDKWALENQMNYLRSFAEKYQLNIVGESQDEASGLTLDRPGLNDFLEAVRQRRDVYKRQRRRWCSVFFR